MGNNCCKEAYGERTEAEEVLLAKAQVSEGCATGCCGGVKVKVATPGPINPEGPKAPPATIKDATPVANGSGPKPARSPEVNPDTEPQTLRNTC
mmetsp:Transcript_38527/g.60085  ORF Transcript_38527/g.60085 Transcript_38527/m.60085 type:complete len:94 (-) Transcript_38527:343-624(-)